MRNKCPCANLYSLADAGTGGHRLLHHGFRGLFTRGSQGYTMIVGHFSAGSCVLLLMLSRIVLRFRHRSPKSNPCRHTGKPDWRI